jgi:hypothetical protein
VDIASGRTGAKNLAREGDAAGSGETLAGRAPPAEGRRPRFTRDQGRVREKSRTRCAESRIYLLTEDGLQTLFWINRPADAEMYFKLIHDHPKEIKYLLTRLDGVKRWSDTGSEPIGLSVTSMNKAEILAL